MKGGVSIPPLRDLPPGRLAQRREHLLFEITSDRGSRGALTRLRPSRWERPSRRRLMLVLAAAVLVVVMGTASAFAVRAAFFLDKGFIGLPPEGATPTNPENAELVVRFYGRSTTLGGALSRVWVYADGRMIWHREGEVAEGANKRTSGFLEQRLTPEGVELLRSEVLATGLFGHDLTLLSQRFGEHNAVWGSVQVHNGNRLIRVTWEDPGIDLQNDDGTIATPEQVSALVRVDALVTDAASWLPADAWEVQKIRAYVPSRYAVCLASPPPAIVEPSQFLPLLPEPAQALLRGREFAPGLGEACTDLTTEEARALGAALNAAGLEQFKGPPPHRPVRADVPPRDPGADPSHQFRALPPARRGHLLGVRMSSRVPLKGVQMKARLAALVALAAAVTLTSFAAAGPDAAKQRVQIDLKVHPGKTFALATLQSGALKRDSGTLGACTGETNSEMLRNGQELFLNACRAAKFTGKRGTLLLRTQIAWAEAGGPYNIATGTWKVVRGTGQYARVAGSGRIAQVGTPSMSVARYQGFLTAP